MKRLIVMILVLFLVLCYPMRPHAAVEEQPLPLSQSSDEEILLFLAEYQIEIPGGEDNFAYWEDFVRKYIAEVENGRTSMPAYNWTVAADFSEQIITAAMQYYRIVSAYGLDTRTSDYVLQHSTTISTWRDEYLVYNCYSYALNKTNYSYDPGAFSDITYTQFPSVSTMSAIVESDLANLEYFCVECTMIEPNMATLSGWDLVICLRMGSDDYHFMKYEGGVWLHKPGRTVPLQWNYSSPAAQIWSNERVYQSESFEPNVYYDSDIYYFISRTEHSYGTYYAGEHYHAGNKHFYKMKYSCAHCGTVDHYFYTVELCEGPPCNLEYMFVAPEVSVS